MINAVVKYIAKLYGCRLPPPPDPRAPRANVPRGPARQFLACENALLSGVRAAHQSAGGNRKPQCRSEPTQAVRAFRCVSLTSAGDFPVVRHTAAPILRRCGIVAGAANAPDGVAGIPARPREPQANLTAGPNGIPIANSYGSLRFSQHPDCGELPSSLRLHRATRPPHVANPEAWKRGAGGCVGTADSGERVVDGVRPPNVFR